MFIGHVVKQSSVYWPCGAVKAVYQSCWHPEVGQVSPGHPLPPLQLGPALKGVVQDLGVVWGQGVLQDQDVV